jgi:hypothetical protein
MTMTNYSIEINEASMSFIQEIVQADIDENNLVRQESAGTAEDEADRRRQRNRVLDRFPNWQVEEGSDDDEDEEGSESDDYVDDDITCRLAGSKRYAGI